MTDAIVRTLFRLLVTRRMMLEWVTAAQAKLSAQLDLQGFYRRMAGGVALGALVAVIVAYAAPRSMVLAAPFVILWMLSPAIARWVSLPPPTGTNAVSDADAQALRLVARRTWRFFETFVTAEDHMLAPDNFQEEPTPVVAHRTSPTNLGLYLLSTVAAHDFGWTGMLRHHRAPGRDAGFDERGSSAFAAISTTGTTRAIYVRWNQNMFLRSTAAIWPEI